MPPWTSQTARNVSYNREDSDSKSFGIPVSKGLRCQDMLEFDVENLGSNQIYTEADLNNQDTKSNPSKLKGEDDVKPFVSRCLGRRTKLPSNKRSNSQRHNIKLSRNDQPTPVSNKTEETQTNQTLVCDIMVFCSTADKKARTFSALLVVLSVAVVVLGIVNIAGYVVCTDSGCDDKVEQYVLLSIPNCKECVCDTKYTTALLVGAVVNVIISLFWICVAIFALRKDFAFVARILLIAPLAVQLSVGLYSSIASMSLGTSKEQISTLSNDIQDIIPGITFAGPYISIAMNVLAIVAAILCVGFNFRLSLCPTCRYYIYDPS